MNVEDVVDVTLRDYKVKSFEIFWDFSFLLLSTHTEEEILVWNINVCEVCNQNVPVWLDLFLALTYDAIEHILGIDESCDCVRHYHAVNLLGQNERLIKDIMANELKLVNHALCSQVDSCSFYHC